MNGRSVMVYHHRGKQFPFCGRGLPTQTLPRDRKMFQAALFSTVSYETSNQTVDAQKPQRLAQVLLQYQLISVK